MLKQSVCDGLHLQKESVVGAAHEELQPMGRFTLEEFVAAVYLY